MRWATVLLLKKSNYLMPLFRLIQAIDTLQAIAIHEGAKREVYLRIAELNNRIYIDLGSETWQLIEVSSDGWRIISDAPVRFRRHADLLPLPIPIGGGSLDTLKNMLNLQGRDWTMVSTWLLNCFKPAPTYPILILHGEAGSGKTTLSAVLKRLIDPGKAPLIPAVGDTRNLAIAANNRYVVGYDNLSGLSAEQSDCLCRIATGGGFSLQAGSPALYPLRMSVKAERIDDCSRAT
jgi:hypothetical protein